MHGPHFRPNVVEAKQQLAENREKLATQHASGSPGVQVCARLADVLDSLLLDLFEAALSSLEKPLARQLAHEVTLVAHGGYGRRDVAPYSDVDLMLLYAPAAANRVPPLAQRITYDIYDSGLNLGFSVRTPREAVRLAMDDATIFTSLAESRELGDETPLYRSFDFRFRRQARGRFPKLFEAILAAREQEQKQYGETVYLLEPNIKRTRGGLRDIQLLRWLGFARYGRSDPTTLQRMGYLSRDDHAQLRDATEFLLRLRNEMHFHAGKSLDVLGRGEQLRLAKVYGFEDKPGILAVESFMGEYFRHTTEVQNIVEHFVASVRPRPLLSRWIGPLFSHQVEQDFRVGPVHISATSRGRAKLKNNLTQVMRLMDLANHYTRRIEHNTWQEIRQNMRTNLEIEVTDEARSRFLSLLSQTGRLGSLLRRLHEVYVLEKIIPELAHARCLLQFNEYHKYTVDEHSIRAVQRATEFREREDVLGHVYRSVEDKALLHLALLLHDLGKGRDEDHSEVGKRIAEATGERLNLPKKSRQDLVFLVHRHLIMAHLAFRRDTSDESLIVNFVREVGDAQRLKMLYVLTCADLAAVGPGVLNEWKTDVLTDLYKRAKEYLPSENEGQIRRLDKDTEAVRRKEVLKLIHPKDRSDFFQDQVESLPPSYLLSTDPQRIADELGRLSHLSAESAMAWGRYSPPRDVVEYTVGAYDRPGIFHRITGVLSSHGLHILAAHINTLSGGLVLDRFIVQDLDFSGPTPPARLETVSRKLVDALEPDSTTQPSFRRVWGTRGVQEATFTRQPPSVRFDNNTSGRFTIIDVFAHDRIGLLYIISRTLYELDLSVFLAKIGTHLDQVVDVFYITDAAGQKVEDEERIGKIRARLLEAIHEQDEPAFPGKSSV